MAILKDGSLTGKIGNLVGYTYKGKNYLKRRPVRTAEPTEGELKSRFMMELVSNWLRPITPVLRKGFRNYSFNFEGFSAAFSVLYKQALVRDGFESRIDPSLVKVSSGDLGLPENLQANLNEQGDLEFSWTPMVSHNQGPRDRVLLLAYDPLSEEALYVLSGAIRYQGRDVLPMADARPGNYHVYAAFVAEDNSSQSDSKYLGEVLLL